MISVNKYQSVVADLTSARSEIERLERELTQLQAEAYKANKRAELADGWRDHDKERADKAEKEVERLKGYGIDAVSDAYDRGSKSAWNDAIEAAAQVANDYDHHEIEGVIRALKRGK